MMPPTTERERAERMTMRSRDWIAQPLRPELRVAPGADPAREARDPFVMDLGWWLGLVRRQGRLIVATVFVVCAISALVLSQLTPQYSATALILVDPRQQAILDPGGQLAVAPGDQGRVESEVEMLRSPSVLLAVVRDKKLFEDPEFVPGPGWRQFFQAVVGLESPQSTSEQVLQQTLESLEARTTVMRMGITYLIAVTVRSTSAQKAADIANAMAEAYVNNQVNTKVAMVVDIRKALLDRLNEASGALRTSEAALNSYIAEHVDQIAESTNRPDLADLRDRIARKAAENQKLANLVSSAQSGLADNDWHNVVASIDSQQLKALYEQRSQIADAIGRGSYAEGSVDLPARLRELDALLASSARGAITGIRNNLDTSRRSEDALRQQLRDQIIQSEMPQGDLVKLYEFQQQANVSRSIYEDLLSRSKTIEAQRDVQVPDSRIASRALPAPKPSFPNDSLVLSVAAALSLVFGVGFAFLRENYIGGLVSEAQTEQVLRIPVVSSLPMLRAGESTRQAAEIVEHPFSPYSEAIRRIRVFLELGGGTHAGRRQIKTVLVTSAVPNEGKTQTAISLARSFAISGRRTLLIDCDLRHPSVHQALGVDLHGGISDYLTTPQPISLDEFILNDDQTGLVVMLGPRARSLGADMLLEHSRFSELLTQAREEFDFVVLDTSPVLPVVDARLLMQHADAAVVVAKWASTPQRDVMSAVNELNRANTRHTTLVAALNMSAVGPSGSYGSSSYGASYGGTGLD